MTNGEGQRVETIAYHEPMRLHVAVEALAPIRQPGIVMWVTNEDRVRVFSIGARENGEALGDLEAGERLEFTIETAQSPIGRPLLRRLLGDRRARRASTYCSTTSGSPRSSPTASTCTAWSGSPHASSVTRTRSGEVGRDDAPTTLPLAEVRGPSAFGGGWRRFLHLTWVISRTDYKLTYFGSILGYLWSFMQPLLFFGVLYVVFAVIITTLSKGVKDFPVLLLMNIVLFSVLPAVDERRRSSSVVMRESLVRKMHFPRLVIPLATVIDAGDQPGVQPGRRARCSCSSTASPRAGPGCCCR